MRRSGGFFQKPIFKKLIFQVLALVEYMYDPDLLNRIEAQRREKEKQRAASQPTTSSSSKKQVVRRAGTDQSTLCEEENDSGSTQNARSRTHTLNVRMVLSVDANYVRKMSL